MLKAKELYSQQLFRKIVSNKDSIYSVLFSNIDIIYSLGPRLCCVELWHLVINNGSGVGNMVPQLHATQSARTQRYIQTVQST